VEQAQVREDLAHHGRVLQTPGSNTYASREACDEAVAVRRGRIARTVAFFRRLGADDTLLRLVGDRVYECRPALSGPSARPPAREPAQSP
jgi:hypothetical protein